LLKAVLITLSALLLFSPVSFAQDYQTQAKFSIPLGVKSEIYIVDRIIDGDTLKLTNGEKIRLIGIDTPETHPGRHAKKQTKQLGKTIEEVYAMGQEATEFVKGLFTLYSKEVILEFDVKRRDKYKRLLAYVFIVTGIKEGEVWDGPVHGPYHYMYREGKEVVFLNTTIIKSGYATPLNIPPDDKYAELFRELYEEAREAKRGLWRE